MSSFLQDVRFAIRGLIQNRGFTLVAILALALGIGANTVIFSIVNAVILRPLPYADSNRLVFVMANHVQLDLINAGSSEPDFVDWSAQNQVFERMGAINDETYNLTGISGDPERLNGARVTASLLQLLGVQPVAGRIFFADEEVEGRNRLVILSYGLWKRRFAGEQSLIGKSILLNGLPYTVAGVMPESFSFPEGKQVWTPFRPLTGSENARGRHNLTVAAKLRVGVSLNQAQTEMDGIAKRLADQHVDTNQGWTVTVRSMQDAITSDIRPVISALFGAVGFVLLIACANVANLLLARSASRRREIAIRAALGAGRWRLIRQFLTESMLLGLAGGLIALLPAMWGIDLFQKFSASEQLVPSIVVRLDLTVLAFTMAIALLTGLLFGIAPALSGSHAEVGSTLKQGGRGNVAGSRLKNIFVVAEVALSLVLLIGAGLMIETFLRVLELRPGFNPDRLMTLRVALPEEKYKSDSQKNAFYETLLDRISAAPGVKAAGWSSSLPLNGSDNGQGIFVEGRPEPELRNIPVVFYRVVTPAYFRTMEIPLLRGRLIEPSDTETAAKVIVVNERTASVLFPNEDAVGKQVRMGRDRTRNLPHTIIGVVGNVRHQTLTGELKSEIYYSNRQRVRSEMSLAIRTEAEPESIVPSVRAQARTLDPDLPLFNLRSMSDMLSRARGDQRLAMLLFAIFAGVALLLAAVGIYGVMAYNVTQRTAEIGLRMALGASQRGVLALVVGKGLRFVLIGLVIGLGASLALTSVLKEMLFGVKPTDPLVYATVALFLGAVALLANYIPARRAARIDPMEALRHE